MNDRKDFSHELSLLWTRASHDVCSISREVPPPDSKIRFQWVANYSVLIGFISTNFRIETLDRPKQNMSKINDH